MNCCFKSVWSYFISFKSTREIFVVYLGNEILLTLYLSITDSFFLWGSQRKRLICVDAIFASIIAPMLYILSLLTRFIPTKPMAVTQRTFSMNRWIPSFRTTNDNICLFCKWPYRCLLSYPFCFRRYIQKSGNKPHDKVLQLWQTNVWRLKIFA